MNHNLWERLQLFINVVSLVVNLIVIGITINSLIQSPAIFPHAFIIPIFGIIIMSSIVMAIFVINKIRNHQNLNNTDIFSLLLLVSSCFVVGYWIFFQIPVITCDYPHNGDTVDLHTTIEGLETNIPNEKTLWIIVFSHDNGRYYPQNKPIEIPSGDPISGRKSGKWSCPAVFGDESNPQKDRGKDFDIIIVLANKDADKSFMNYLSTNQVYIGVASVPSGVIQYQVVNVKRS